MRPFTPERAATLEAVFPKTTPGDVINAMNERAVRAVSEAIESIDAFFGRGKNAESLRKEPAVVTARLHAESQAIRAAGESAIRSVDAAVASGEPIPDPTEALERGFLDSTLGAFRRTAERGVAFLRKYAEGLPESDTKAGDEAWFVETIYGRRDDPEIVDKIESALELKRKGAPWDLPAFLYQKFHSKPTERNEIIQAMLEGDTKKNMVAGLVDRIRSSEHLTDEEVRELLGEISEMSDEELACAEPNAFLDTYSTEDQQREEGLSDAFVDQVRDALERHIATRLSGKKILTVTTALIVVPYLTMAQIKMTLVMKMMAQPDMTTELFIRAMKKVLDPAVIYDRDPGKFASVFQN